MQLRSGVAVAAAGLAAAAPIRHLAWELPYAAGAALKKKKKRKERKQLHILKEFLCDSAG